MFLTANTLIKRKTKGTIELSGQFGLSGHKLELIRPKSFFLLMAGFELDLTQCALELDGALGQQPIVP